MELNSKNIKKILLIILFGVIAFTAMQNFSNLMKWLSKTVSLFSPVIVALCIAFVLNVLLTALENKVFRFMDKSPKKAIRKLKRPISLVLTYFIAFGIIVLLLLVIIPDISETIIYIAERLPSFMKDAREWIETTLKSFNISQNDIPEMKINWNATANTIKEYISSDSNKIFGNAINITTSVFSGVFDMVFSIVISVYVLAQKERIGTFVKKCISAFIPKKSADIIYHISYQTYDSFSKFIGGQLTESVILGALCFIGMTIFRFPNAPIISVLICVTSLVPIIGATIGVVVGFLLILITNPLNALLFVVFFLVLQQIEGTLIYPKVVGKSVGLPGIIVVSSVLVGGNIGGIVGSLISVPVSAVLFILLKEEVNKRLTRRTPIKTSNNN